MDIINTERKQSKRESGQQKKRWTEIRWKNQFDEEWGGKIENSSEIYWSERGGKICVIIICPCRDGKGQKNLRNDNKEELEFIK